MIHRAEACRNKALNCERAALIATDSNVQAAYRDMARQWREIAEQETGRARKNNVTWSEAGGSLPTGACPDRDTTSKPGRGLKLRRP